MAFRIKAAACAILIASVVQAASYQVRHVHSRKGQTGTLTVTETGVSFKEEGKHDEHSRDWRFTDIQQAKLSKDRLRILTYEDEKWRLGRDREYTFDELPEGFTAAVLPALRNQLHDRFIEAIPGDSPAAWQLEAKLQHKFSGSGGVLRFSPDTVEFQSKNAGDSRTWPIADIDSISSAGPYDLTISTYERAGFSHAAISNFHFQLKERLSDERYNSLWRTISARTGITAFMPTEGEHHHEK